MISPDGGECLPCAAGPWIRTPRLRRSLPARCAISFRKQPCVGQFDANPCVFRCDSGLAQQHEPGSARGLQRNIVGAAGNQPSVRGCECKGQKLGVLQTDSQCAKGRFIKSH